MTYLDEYTGLITQVEFIGNMKTTITLDPKEVSKITLMANGDKIITDIHGNTMTIKDMSAYNVLRICNVGDLYE